MSQGSQRVRSRAGQDQASCGACALDSPACRARAPHPGCPFKTWLFFLGHRDPDSLAPMALTPHGLSVYAPHPSSQNQVPQGQGPSLGPPPDSYSTALSPRCPSTARDTEAAFSSSLSRGLDELLACLHRKFALPRVLNPRAPQRNTAGSEPHRTRYIRIWPELHLCPASAGSLESVG